MSELISSAVRRGEDNPVWVIVGVSAGPRRWTSGEIALAEEATERIWAAIERARAEAALRESEEALAADLGSTELLGGLAERLVTDESAGALYDEILSAAVEVARSDAGTLQITILERSPWNSLQAVTFPEA